MDQIIKILTEIKPECEFSSSDDFILNSTLDSFDIITLVTELEETYNIFIDALDIVPENFCSVQAIASVVRKNGGTI
ncbi:MULTISPECIES: acyl carrier protein [Lysinibacillus]|uniref:Acyl carrier protein n=1 Tax=Lysinibacillus xylanilyticus TaxID=582475 RepID=A0ABV3VWY9_9BACI